MKVINNLDFDFNTSYKVPSATSLSISFGSFVHYILMGESNRFVSIWADVNAGHSGGKVYIASGDSLQVVDLSENKVVDYVSQTQPGRANEILEQNDIIDINIGG